MKNASKNFLLWQRKRNELPVNDDLQADWGHMASLLDEHMPVVKKTGGFKGFRGLPAIFITFSAAAMLYVAGNIYTLDKRSHGVKHHFHKGNPMRPGSHLSNIPDSTNTKANTANTLPGSKYSTASSDIQPVSTDKNNAAGTIGKAASSTNNTALAVSGKQATRSGSANAHYNLLTHQGQNHPSGSQASVHKSGFGGGGAAPHNGHIRPGGGNSARNKLPDGNKSPDGHNSHNQNAANINAHNDRDGTGNITPLLQPALKFDLNLAKIQPSALPLLSSRLSQVSRQAGKPSNGSKKDKPAKPQNSKPSAIDWGLLMGVNASGSFTPKGQNANFYGSAPIDPWFGVFASYKLNDSWAISTEAHFFSPQNITTTYIHANQSKVDSGQSLTITATRKMYAVSVPVYAVYNAGNGLHFKAGLVINLPVKQINTGSILLPYSIRTDTTYYKNVSSTLSATQYRQNINFGFAAGASYQYKRFIFGATYLKSLSGYGISSGLGTYKSYNGTFQITIGFQLDKVKP